jgi:ankyrin repeat protein
MVENLEEQLYYACKNGNLDLVKDLVNQGANNRTWNDRALHWAASAGYLSIVKFLVSRGADIHAYNARGLRLATLNGYTDIVNFLEGILLSEKRKKVWQKI